MLPLGGDPHLRPEAASFQVQRHPPVFVPLLLKTLIIRSPPTLLQGDLILTSLYLQRAYFQARSHSQAQGWGYEVSLVGT